MKLMDYYDLPVLIDAGFEVGFSGTSWFGKDTQGKEWQVVLEDYGNLLFRKEEGQVFGALEQMSREDFDRTFGSSHD